jgi:modulator of drug activity B
MTMHNVLIVNGHQQWTISRGDLNRALVRVAAERLEASGWDVRITTIEEGYDVAAEIDRLEWANAILFQFPAYWYSVPWGLKKYIDTVFTTGRGRIYLNDGRSRSDPSRKYGSGGTLQGRRYMISTTWNAPREAFGDPDQIFKGGRVDDVFLGLHVGLQFIGLAPLESFSCHDVVKNGDTHNDLRRFAEHIDRQFAALAAEIAERACPI